MMVAAAPSRPVLRTTTSTADLTTASGNRISTVVSGADVGMVAPSGLELHDGLLFVSDNVGM